MTGPSDRYRCSRRTLLAAAASTAATTLAGCGETGTGTTDSTPTSTGATASTTPVGEATATTERTTTDERTASAATNVTDPRFGAVGDEDADDTAAIRAAVDAAGGAGTVYFPPGEYRVSGAIDLGGASVVGGGRYEATVRADSGGDWALGIAEPGGDESVLWAENEDHWSVRHVGVDSNGENASCVTNYGGSWVALTDIHARSSDDSGVQHWGGAGADTNECRHCLTAHNAVRNCRWNLVFDGDVANANMVGNVSVNGGARHVSLDNRTHNDRDMRGVTVANNALRGHGDQADAEHAIYMRGGRARDAQRSTDGTVFGQVHHNEIRDWPAVGIQMTRATGSVESNALRTTAAADGFDACLVVDEHRAGLRVAANAARVTADSTMLDHAAAAPGRALSVLRNRTATDRGTFYASAATDDAWLFDENYAGTTEVDP